MSCSVLLSLPDAIIHCIFTFLSVVELFTIDSTIESSHMQRLFDNFLANNPVVYTPSGKQTGLDGGTLIRWMLERNVNVKRFFF